VSILLDRKGRPAIPRLRIQHNQCCYCWRLAHRGTAKPHGKPLPDLSRVNYSHGVCRECYEREIARLRLVVANRQVAN
jgi:hypothetical protein